MLDTTLLLARLSPLCCLVGNWFVLSLKLLFYLEEGGKRKGLICLEVVKKKSTDSYKCKRSDYLKTFIFITVFQNELDWITCC